MSLANSNTSAWAVNENTTGAATRTYRVSEAVGTCRDPDPLEAAVDELEVSGCDRAAIPVLWTNAKASDQF